MRKITKVKFKIRCIIEEIMYRISRFVPKKRVVLLTAWFGQKYIDNTKYVYEYLLDEKDYQVIWMTKSHKIYKELKEKGMPVELFNSFKGLLLQLRCVAVFSTVQFTDFNTSLLTRCLYIDLGHGHPIKDPGRKAPVTRLHQRMLQKRFHYYAIVASDFSKSVTPQTVNMPSDHIIISDYARNDVFIDEKLRVGKNLEIEDIKRGRKAVVYMPTHRSDGKKVLNLSQILPLKEIEEVCEKNNWVFIVKKHFYHRNEQEDFSQYPNIFDVTNIDTLDPQVLLYQADVLVSDYSACYIDYMLLKRPLLFYQFDINDFQENQRTLYFPFTELKIAPIAYTKAEFWKTLNSLICQKEDGYYKTRNEFAHVYFNNTEQKNGREKVKIILDDLMKQYDL